MLHRQLKKILIITSEFPPDTGGIGNHALNLALHLAENNFGVSVLADIIHASQQDIKNAAWSGKINVFPVYRNKIIFLTYYQRIQKSIALARKNDVIILSGKFSVWLTGLLKFFYPGKKLIAIVHGSELRLQKTWQRKLVNNHLLKCNSIIAVSEFTKSLLPHAVLQQVKCFVIPNGINAEEFSNIEIKQVVRPSEKLQLITVGSVTERKGQLLVLQALPEIIKKFPAVCYHIVGRPVLKKEIEEIITLKNLNGHVIVHGVVERKKLIELLSISKIKLMLSTNTSSGDVEGFGIAILEANALGIPAIGSKNTGIEDAIKNNETGILVDPKNTFEITEAIEKILNNYSSFSANAKRWALQHDWKIITDQYIDIIEKAF